MADFAQILPAMIDELVEGFGESVLFEPATGSPVSLRGIVNRGSDHADVTGLYAFAVFRVADLAGFADPEERGNSIRGHLTFRGVRCVIVGQAKYNGDGTMDLLCRLA